MGKDSDIESAFANAIAAHNATLQPGTPVVVICESGMTLYFAEVVEAPELLFGQTWIVHLRDMNRENRAARVNNVFVNTPLEILTKAARKGT